MSTTNVPIAIGTKTSSFSSRIPLQSETTIGYNTPDCTYGSLITISYPREENKAATTPPTTGGSPSSRTKKTSSGEVLEYIPNPHIKNNIKERERIYTEASLEIWNIGSSTKDQQQQQTRPFRIKYHYHTSPSTANNAKHKHEGKIVFSSLQKKSSTFTLTYLPANQSYVIFFCICYQSSSCEFHVEKSQLHYLNGSERITSICNVGASDGSKNHIMIACTLEGSLYVINSLRCVSQLIHPSSHVSVPNRSSVSNVYYTPLSSSSSSSSSKQQHQIAMEGVVSHQITPHEILFYKCQSIPSTTPSSKTAKKWKLDLKLQYHFKSNTNVVLGDWIDWNSNRLCIVSSRNKRLQVFCYRGSDGLELVSAWDLDRHSLEYHITNTNDDVDDDTNNTEEKQSRISSYSYHEPTQTFVLSGIDTNNRLSFLTTWNWRSDVTGITIASPANDFTPSSAGMILSNSYNPHMYQLLHYWYTPTRNEVLRTYDVYTMGMLSFHENTPLFACPKYISYPSSLQVDIWKKQIYPMDYIAQHGYPTQIIPSSYMHGTYCIAIASVRGLCIFIDTPSQTKQYHTSIHPITTIPYQPKWKLLPTTKEESQISISCMTWWNLPKQAILVLLYHSHVTKLHYLYAWSSTSRHLSLDESLFLSSTSTLHHPFGIPLHHTSRIPHRIQIISNENRALLLILSNDEFGCCYYNMYQLQHQAKKGNVLIYEVTHGVLDDFVEAEEEIVLVGASFCFHLDGVQEEKASLDKEEYIATIAMTSKNSFSIKTRYITPATISNPVTTSFLPHVISKYWKSDVIPCVGFVWCFVLSNSNVYTWIFPCVTEDTDAKFMSRIWDIADTTTTTKYGLYPPLKPIPSSSPHSNKQTNYLGMLSCAIADASHYFNTIHTHDNHHIHIGNTTHKRVLYGGQGVTKDYLLNMQCRISPCSSPTESTFFYMLLISYSIMLCNNDDTERGNDRSLILLLRTRIQTHFSSCDDEDAVYTTSRILLLRSLEFVCDVSSSSQTTLFPTMELDKVSSFAAFILTEVVYQIKYYMITSSFISKSTHFFISIGRHLEITHFDLLFPLPAFMEGDDSLYPPPNNIRMEDAACRLLWRATTIYDFLELTMMSTTTTSVNSATTYYPIAALALPLLPCKQESHDKCLQLLHLALSSMHYPIKKGEAGLIRQLFRYGRKLEEAVDYSTNHTETEEDESVPVENDSLSSLLLVEKDSVNHDLLFSLEEKKSESTSIPTVTEDHLSGTKITRNHQQLSANNNNRLYSYLFPDYLKEQEDFLKFEQAIHEAASLFIDDITYKDKIDSRNPMEDNGYHTPEKDEEMDAHSSLLLVENNVNTLSVSNRQRCCDRHTVLGTVCHYVLLNTIFHLQHTATTTTTPLWNHINSIACILLPEIKTLRYYSSTPKNQDGDSSTTINYDDYLKLLQEIFPFNDNNHEDVSKDMILQLSQEYTTATTKKNTVLFEFILHILLYLDQRTVSTKSNHSFNNMDIFHGIFMLTMVVDPNEKSEPLQPRHDDLIDNCN